MKNPFQIQIYVASLLLWILLLVVNTGYAQKPVLSTTLITHQQVNLAWTRFASTPEQYIVERKEGDKEQHFARISGVLDSTHYSFEDKNVEANKTYTYRLYYNCIKNCGGPYSDELKVITPLAPPSLPKNLEVTALSASTIHLTWTSSDTAQVSFDIERSIDGVTFAKIDEIGFSTTYNYTDKGLKSATNYCYRLKAKNASGESGYSSQACAFTKEGLPAAPSELIAVADLKFQVQLTWTDESSDETGFEIERSSTGIDFEKIASVAANTTQYLDGPLTPDSKFYYRIRSVNSIGASGYSIIAIATTSIEPPAPPTNLKIDSVFATRIDIIWTDNASSESGFEIQRSLNGTDFNFIADVGANVTKFKNVTLSPLTPYWYRILAKNKGGVSIFSNIVKVTTLDSIPNKPKNLTATPISNQRVNLGWTDDSNNETGFEIEISSDSITYTLLSVVTANTVSYSSEGLATFSKYWYRVRAINALGKSAYSNITKVITFDLPPVAPSDLVATTISSSQIDLSWVDNSKNETGFIIESSIDGENYTKIGETVSDSITFKNKGLLPATKYWYRVKAQNALGSSTWSNITSAITKDIVPANPLELTAIALDFSSVQLSWKDVSKNESGFEIERSLDGVSFAKVGEVAANTIQFLEVGLTQLTPYYYRVRAVNAVGNSGYSNVVSVTTPKAPLPAKPENLKIIPLDFDLIRLTWDPVSTNTMEVIIERSTAAETGFVQIGRQEYGQNSFDDQEILEVMDYYYRIKGVNSIGSSEYSEVATLPATAIITGVENKNVQIWYYDSILHINSPDSKSSWVTVYSSNGTMIDNKEVKSKEYTQRLSHLVSGIYIIKLEKEGRSYFQKIAITGN